MLQLYTKASSKDDVQGGFTSQELPDAYKQAESDAMDEIYQYVRDEVIKGKRVVMVASLLARLKDLMSSRGQEKLRESLRKHMRRKLECAFGNSIKIFPDEKGKLVLVSDCLTVQEVVTENLKLQNEIDVLQAKANGNQLIDQASTIIRHAIKNTKNETPWPLHPHHSRFPSHYTVSFLVSLQEMLLQQIYHREWKY